MFLIFGTLRLFMMATNLFVIANVKQLRTGGSFRIFLPFFRTSRGVGVLNSAIFNSFHNRVEFGTIFWGLRNFGGGEGFEPPQTPPPSVRHWCHQYDFPHISVQSSYCCTVYSPTIKSVLFPFSACLIIYILL